MRALDLVVRAFGPRRSHSISVCTRFVERVLPLSLRVEVFLLRLQKRAVVSAHAQKTVGVDAVEFDHVVGHIFEKIAIVADHDARERRVLQECFEPLDAREVQMIGRLVEQQDVRLLHEGLGNRQALAPAAGQAPRCALRNP